jgi:uncharacterized repeat protein (TIGR01451 family)
MNSGIRRINWQKLFFLLFFISLPLAGYCATTWTVCSGGGCNYLTLSAAYASGSVVTGDTLELRSDITDNLDLSTSKVVNITSQAGSIYTVTGTGTNPTLWIHPNFDAALNPWTVTNVNWDHSGGDGYTFMDDSRKAYVTFTNCTLQRSYSGGSNNSVVYTNQDIESITFKQCTFIGIANEYGVNKNSGNSSVGLAMINLENCVLYGFTGTGAAVRSADNNNIMAVKMLNCTVFNNNIGYLDSYGGTNNVLPALVQNTLFIGNTTDLSLAAGAVAASRAHFVYDAFQQQTTSAQFGAGCLFAGDGITAAGEVVNPATSGTPDLHLLSSAKSVNAGSSANSAPAVDREGTSRPQGPAWDIGAYECLQLIASKSASVTFAYIGDTITFCITVTNTSAADMDTYVWDSVPAQMVYYGCDNTCTESGGSPDVVSWYISVGAGQSKTLCFWARVASYPFIIRQGELFAGVRGRVQKAAINERSVLALCSWKYLQACAEKNAVQN